MPVRRRGNETSASSFHQEDDLRQATVKQGVWILMVLVQIMVLKVFKNPMRVIEPYHSPSPPSTPRNNMNDRDVHMYNPEDNFRVFELPHPQAPDLYPTSISFKPSDLGQMTCSLLGSLSPFVKWACNNDIYFIGLF